MSLKIKLKVMLLFFIFSALMIVSSQSGVFAHEYSFRSEFYNVSPGEKLSVTLGSESTEKFSKSGSLVFKISFNPEIFTYNKIVRNNNIKRSEIHAEKEKGLLTIEYNPKQSCKTLGPDNELLDIVFTVKKRAPLGETSIFAEAQEEAYPEFSSLDKMVINITSLPKTDGPKLKNLSPSAGSLNPLFNPKTYEYEITVPCQTKYIEFSTELENAEHNVKISRRKLCAAGKSVNVKIIVSSKNSRLKSVYTVHVKRKALPNKIKTSKTKKNSLTKRSSVRDNSSDSEYDPSHKESYSLESEDEEIPETEEEMLEANEDNIDSTNYEPDNNISNNESFENTELKNNNQKIYSISILILLVLWVLIYYIIKFIKRKNSSITK